MLGRTGRLVTDQSKSDRDKVSCIPVRFRLQLWITQGQYTKNYTINDEERARIEQPNRKKTLQAMLETAKKYCARRIKYLEF